MSDRGTTWDFDFWVGEWDVFGPEGPHVGTNGVTVLFGGALAERWRGDRGVEGHSLNAYDAPADRWHQTWVDSTGGLLLLDGGLLDGAMVLEGTAPAEPGTAPEWQRITWRREGEGERGTVETRHMAM